MELFPSTSRSCVCTALIWLFSFSALCWGSCQGNQPGLARGAPKPTCSDVFLWSPLGFEEGWQDPWEQKQLEGGPFIAMCTPLPSAMLRGYMIPQHSQGCSEQPLPCALAVLMLSLGCHCQHAHSGGVPCPAGRRAGLPSFRRQMTLDFLTLGQAPQQQLWASFYTTPPFPGT